jgi:hypothetical protein
MQDPSSSKEVFAFRTFHGKYLRCEDPDSLGAAEGKVCVGPMLLIDLFVCECCDPPPA